MGLPLFVEPSDAEVIASASEKIVAIPRSTIRRRPMPRPRNTVSSLRRRLLGSLEHDRVAAAQLWEESTRPSASREYLDAALAQSSRTSRELSNDRNGDRDFAGSYRAARESSSQDVSSPYATRQNRLRTILRPVRPIIQLSDGRMVRRHAAPTPPYHEDEADSYDQPAPPPPPRMSAITPALSPAPPSGNNSPVRRRATPDDEESFLSRMHNAQRRSSLSERYLSLNRTDDDWRRFGNQARSARIQRLAAFDGLGDRNRSLSPDGAWDTILTSITPDPQLPSAGSSFASASAATATNSLPNSESLSPTSLMTSMTSTDSVGAARLAALVDCEISDDTDTDEEDEEDAYEFHNISRPSREWRSHATDMLSDPSSLRALLRSEHLDGMHHVITGLAERDEIPDEYWASMGLSRIIPGDRSG